MKKLLFMLPMVIYFISLQAQNPLSQTTQVEIGLGFVLPFLQAGKELSRAEQLREHQLSYFENSQGERNTVGRYPRLSGFALNFDFYKPLKKVSGLMMGAVVRNAQTGAQPAEGGYAEAYYFNFITAGVALKYYLFKQLNWYAKADAGLAAVLTKNRFLNEAGEQNFFHQFGIGTAGALGVGYSLAPFRDKTKSFNVQVTYQQLSTRVEVNSIGDDQWRFGALQYSAIYSF